MCGFHACLMDLMRTIFLRALSSLFLFAAQQLHAFTGQPHHTTAFIAPPGTVWALPSFSYQWTDTFWNRSGRRLPTYDRVTSHAYALYAEYALDPSNSLTLNGEYKRHKQPLCAKKYMANDLEIGWKHALYQNNSFALTAGLIAIVPVCRKSENHGNLGAQFSLLHSQWLACCRKKCWLDLAIAYRRSAHIHSDQIRGEVALNFVPITELRLTALAQFQWNCYLGNSQRHRLCRRCPPAVYRKCTLQIEGALKLFSHAYAVFGVFKDVSGRQVLMNKGVLSGIWLDF